MIALKLMKKSEDTRKSPVFEERHGSPMSSSGSVFSQASFEHQKSSSPERRLDTSYQDHKPDHSDVQKDHNQQKLLDQLQQQQQLMLQASLMGMSGDMSGLLAGMY